jgi:hypothetical protein
MVGKWVKFIPNKGPHRGEALIGIVRDSYLENGWSLYLIEAKVENLKTKANKWKLFHVSPKKLLQIEESRSDFDRVRNY